MILSKKCRITYCEKPHTHTLYQHQSITSKPRETQEKIRFVWIMHWNWYWLDEKSYQLGKNWTSLFFGFWFGFETINSSCVYSCSFIYLDPSVLYILYVQPQSDTHVWSFNHDHSNCNVLWWASIMEKVAIPNTQLHTAKSMHCRFWEGVVVEKLP